MILPFDDKYRISSETQQWIIQRSRCRNGEPVWESFRYFTRFDLCIGELGEILIRELNADGIQEATQAVHDLCDRIAQAFMPVLQIKYRIGPEETGGDETIGMRLR